MIDPVARDKIIPLLRSDENLLWADKPHKFPVMGIALVHLLTSVLGVIFISYTFFYILFSEDLTHVWQKALILTIMLLFIWGFAAGFKFHSKLILGPVYEIYGITDKRALIVSPYKDLQTVIISPEEMGDIRILGNHKIGTIRFETLKLNPWSFAYKYNIFARKSDLSAFRNIRNPREVETFIRKTFPIKGTTP